MEKAYKLDFDNEKRGSLYVNCCGCSRTGPLHRFGPAIKPHFLIHFVLSGKGFFRFGEKEYHLDAGYGFLIWPEELAFYQADKEDPWTYVWVGFGGSESEHYLHSMGLDRRHPVFKSEYGEELYETVRDMMEHNTFGLANDLRRNGLLSVFLSIIASGINIVNKNETDRSSGYVQKAVSFIQSNYCDPIMVKDIAEYVCINRSYLYTLFRETIGVSPQQFLTTCRIVKARELLESTSYSIESIALSCGYGDALNFNKAFRGMFDMPPSSYRKQARETGGRQNKEQLKEIEDLIPY